MWAVPGTEGDDVGSGRIPVNGHLAHYDGAGLEVLGALLCAKRRELVAIEIGEAVGIGGIVWRGADKNPSHGVQVGPGGEPDDHRGVLELRLLAAGLANCDLSCKTYLETGCREKTVI